MAQNHATLPLDGRHAVVTGGGSGIGAAIARSLASKGAAITLVGRRDSQLRQVAVNLPKAHCIVADIADEIACAEMVKAARAAHGPVDIVVANAGIAEAKPFARMDLAHWQRTIDVNLTGTFLTLKALLPDLLRTSADTVGVRRIICIASTAGLKGYPYVADYAASKHGVVGLVRALAAEYARSSLTVNAICPGYVETPLVTRAIASIVASTGRSETEALASLTEKNPQRRLIAPEEVAEAVLWLCLPAARSVTGQAIAISGGEI